MKTHALLKVEDVILVILHYTVYQKHVSPEECDTAARVLLENKQPLDTSKSEEGAIMWRKGMITMLVGGGHP